ncbi:MAG: poly-gamma-glutamate synthase PgsB [Calditrichota bacterium]
MLILLLILVALFGYGAWEYRGHQQRLRLIPLRIHVNGSRGKSSVTRLIAAGLRAGGIRTVGKVTGTLPRIIDPEGREIAIVRDQPANIIEQIKIIRYVQRWQPQAIVIECMAVLPDYQWICEHEFIKATIGVVTNARLDHINEMGKFREQIARSLANTVPRNGKFFTSEKSHLGVFEEAGARLGSQVQRIGSSAMTAEEMKSFSYIEHPANVGLSLAVCQAAGVDRETALKGMYDVIPDSGALRVALCREGDKEILFANAMAANDPESTLVIWKQIEEQFQPTGTVILQLNSRSDRQDRSVQLIEMAAGNINFDYLVLTGENLHKFMALALRYRIPKSKLVGLGWVKPEKAYEELFKLVQDKGTVLGIGNMGAGGIDIFRYFYKNRGTTN